jgi:hypothetical protein
MLNMPAIILVGFYFRRRRSLANSICKCGIGVGAVAFPPLIPLFLQHFGLRGSLLLVGGICLNMLVAAMLLRPVSFYQKQKKRAENSEQIGSDGRKDATKTEKDELLQKTEERADKEANEGGEEEKCELLRKEKDRTCSGEEEITHAAASSKCPSVQDSTKLSSHNTASPQEPSSVVTGNLNHVNPASQNINGALVSGPATACTESEVSGNAHSGSSTVQQPQQPQCVSVEIVIEQELLSKSMPEVFLMVMNRGTTAGRREAFLRNRTLSESQHHYVYHPDR